MFRISNKTRSTQVGVLSIVLGIAIYTLALPSVKVDAQIDCDAECRKGLAAVRAATAKYHDVNEALADGFVPASPCVQIPNVGAMGIHFVNHSRVDQNVNVREPEILLYLPDGSGELHLVAVEYFVPFVGTNPAPTLFGQTFAGPMPGHAPGEPFHYDLHVWIWRHNPSGMFTQFNSKLSCP